MKSYLDIVNHVLNKGVAKFPVRRDPTTGISTPVDGGIKTLACANVPFSHDMADGFPLLTTRKMPWQSIRVELEGFIKGITDKRWFEERNCYYWSYWCNPQQKPKGLTKEQIKTWQKTNPDLGPIGYSHGWRNFGAAYKPIPFIWTSFDKNIEVVSSEDKLVGKTFDGKYGLYTVTRFCQQDKNYIKKYDIKFHTSGYIKNNVVASHIKSGKVYDPYFPSVYNVACYGDYKTKTKLDKRQVKSLMNQWRHMIARCYNTKHDAYHRYGGNGVYVVNRWLIFENFLQDIVNIQGWDKKLNNWKKYNLDKDLLGGNCYAPEFCSWVTREENNNHTKLNYYFDAISPSGYHYQNQIGLNRFCRKHNLKTTSVEYSISNNTEYNGWKFYRKGELKNDQSNGIDQLQNIVNTLSSNPNDRRMICSAWDVKNLNTMALMPCHMMWSVNITDNKLNLFWMQRSADVGLGVPSNIASYALLLCLLADIYGYERGNLSAIFVDCHIYENHFDKIKEQTKRSPRRLPRLEKININSIFDWSYKDVKLSEYNPHPKLSIGDVAI